MPPSPLRPDGAGATGATRSTSGAQHQAAVSRGSSGSRSRTPRRRRRRAWRQVARRKSWKCAPPVAQQHSGAESGENPCTRPRRPPFPSAMRSSRSRSTQAKARDASPTSGQICMPELSRSAFLRSSSASAPPRGRVPSSMLCARSGGHAALDYCTPSRFARFVSPNWQHVFSSGVGERAHLAEAVSASPSTTICMHQLLIQSSVCRVASRCAHRSAIGRKF